MHSPKLRPPVIKEQDEGFYHTIRWGLLVWACLRLLVSVIWTGTIILATIGYFQHALEETNYDQNRSRLWTYIYSIVVQLVEFGMLVTFITAGVKKSASLYRAYYRYCIMTLIIYTIAVPLSFTLDAYGYAIHFIGVYLTYHIDMLPIIGDFYYFYLAFFLAAFFDIVLEIMMIILIKKLIKRYSFSPSEDV